jgi:hypothetical protein
MLIWNIHVSSVNLAYVAALGIKYGIIFSKIVVVHFWNIFLVGASQKNPFLTLRK